ncbi:unnamed protein product [Blepharisma stoltei]|uniref:Uncharacterized protein n=1 Tax=Blepharisma stoltei TaxID=1481888 RepID=A0AAU9J395_9CILI|nr:unnamed protein product [Blepharisma stoltei]
MSKNEQIPKPRSGFSIHNLSPAHHMHNTSLSHDTSKQSLSSEIPPESNQSKKSPNSFIYRYHSSRRTLTGNIRKSPMSRKSSNRDTLSSPNTSLMFASPKSYEPRKATIDYLEKYNLRLKRNSGDSSQASANAMMEIEECKEIDSRMENERNRINVFFTSGNAKCETNAVTVFKSTEGCRNYVKNSKIKIVYTV